MKLRNSFLLFSLITFSSFGSERKIRVRIHKEMKSFLVSGIDLERKVYKSGKKKFYPGQSSIKFNCDLSRKSNQQKTKRIYSISSPSGVVSIKGKKYFGKVDVISSYKAKGCDLINIVSIEDYISTLLAHEMNASWPLEALKAQAVAARSYALFKIKSRQVSRSLGFEAYYDLESSEKHQVSGNLLSVTSRTRRAAFETRGRILIDKKGVETPIFFHARCGGKTFRPHQVWKNRVGSYKRVNCPSCKVSTKGDWKFYLSKKRLTKFLSWAKKRTINTAKKIRLAQDHLNKNVIRFYEGEKPVEVNKKLFRKYFGRFKFYSNLFQVKSYSSGFIFSGKGNGHGVGMCQIGARALSKSGSSYQQILKHYYPNYRLMRTDV